MGEEGGGVRPLHDARYSPDPGPKPAKSRSPSHSPTVRSPPSTKGRSRTQEEDSGGNESTTKARCFCRVERRHPLEHGSSGMSPRLRHSRTRPGMPTKTRRSPPGSRQPRRGRCRAARCR
jgi:hypothetical protein